MNRVILLILALTAGASAGVAQTLGKSVFDFEGSAAGPASDCTPGLTGGGEPVDWQIVEDESSPAGPKVLAETSGDTTNDRFSLCILSAPAFADGEISVAFKPVSGNVDQAAGLMLRVLDQDNYYIARANALEGNVRFYKVEAGRREQLAGADLPVENGTWQTLSLSMRGPVAEILLNGQVLFNVEDKTFSEAGGAGLWTKADSLTYFDDVHVRPEG